MLDIAMGGVVVGALLIDWHYGVLAKKEGGGSLPFFPTNDVLPLSAAYKAAYLRA